MDTPQSAGMALYMEQNIWERQDEFYDLPDGKKKTKQMDELEENLVAKKATLPFAK